ncbi:MAG: metalloregulator ArsR/SmtB family transcription factor [Clostridiales bacterium]|nr:metalloregulator ArsR/SmtB family transcription factor [Clostridiales bacterium]
MLKAETLFKALADETRLKILRALSEREAYVELLAERMQLSPATVSFHMKKLSAAGLVKARKEQYYAMYSLKEEALNMTLKELVLPGGEGDASEKLREEQYRQKVLKTFMPDGFCPTMPAQFKKRQMVLEKIFGAFEVGKVYPEREVNEIIERFHNDYCMVRRAFVDFGWMTRKGAVYTVVGIPEDAPG